MYFLLEISNQPPAKVRRLSAQPSVVASEGEAMLGQGAGGKWKTIQNPKK